MIKLIQQGMYMLLKSQRVTPLEHESEYSLCLTKKLPKSSLRGVNSIFILCANDTYFQELITHPLNLCKIPNLGAIV